MLPRLILALLLCSFLERNSALDTKPREDMLLTSNLISSQTLKIILFFALLLIALLACGIPIIAIDCLMRKINRRNEARIGILANSENDLINSTDSFPQQPPHQVQQDFSQPASPSTFAAHQRKLKLWLSRISCFAGGVFLAAGFLDLFPEVGKAFEEAKKALKIDTEYPFPALFTIIGLFIVLTLEQGVSVCHHSKAHEHHTSNHNHNHNVYTSHVDMSMSEDSVQEVVEHNFFKTLTLLVAISIHAVFDGLAIGLQKTTSEIMSLFIAMILHKIIIGVSIGVNLATLRVQKDSRTGVPHSASMKIQAIGAVIFALTTPLGVLIGWALVEREQTGAMLMTIAVLQGLACGTFFFVVFCEILPDEFREESPDRIIKLAFLFAGFVLLAVCLYFI